ncbi:MAG: prephenate dehydrogenase/arogenate dehydrogenase family protein [Anaerolineales bacterium]|nr:prephenate dehydrogenase/arogenate dehydrogenase family protein [Anaerolineales bacterium]
MRTGEPSFDLAQQRVTILGLGLMGGSLALALQGRVARLMGCDQDGAVVALAHQQGFLDQVSTDLVSLLPQTDLLVLAAPVRANLAVLARLPELAPDGLAVIDLSSTKMEIVNAMEQLPEQFVALGGHPMCGKAHSGLAHAEAALFQEKVFVWTPTARTTAGLRSLATQITQAVRADELWLPAEQHDHWTAASSHLPYLLAVALVAATPLEAKALIGSGFGSTTRIAASGVDMRLDILLTNQEPLLAVLERFRSRLAEFEIALQAVDALRLQQLMTEARSRHAQLVTNKEG